MLLLVLGCFVFGFEVCVCGFVGFGFGCGLVGGWVI